MAKKRCVLLVVGQDGETYCAELEAESLFEAAHRAIEDWSKLWWWSSDLIIEIRAGRQVWRVHADRVSRWYGEQFRRKLN